VFGNGCLACCQLRGWRHESCATMQPRCRRRARRQQGTHWGQASSTQQLPHADTTFYRGAPRARNHDGSRTVSRSVFWRCHGTLPHANRRRTSSRCSSSSLYHACAWCSKKTRPKLSSSGGRWRSFSRYFAIPPLLPAAPFQG
jgi:hypothetical protein